MLNTLLKNDCVHLFVDHNKNIFNIEILSSDYNSDQKKELIDYINNFWIFVQASEQKYHIIINVHNLGLCHIGIFDEIIKLLKLLEPIFVNHQHSSCLILKSDNGLNLLKPLFNMHKSVRPFTFVENLEEAYTFFAQPGNTLI